jgi:hypothetical protein
MASTAAPTAPKNKPVIKKQLGNISVAVFTRDVTTPDGKNFTAKDYVLQKSWKDKNGNWQDQSIILKQREILAVQKALDGAFADSYDEQTNDQE